MMADPTLDSFRSSMKFSLWAWAAYWPGGGLLLLAGGMTDPMSIAVVLLASAGLLLAYAGGALRSGPSGKWSLRRFLLERPIYLLVALVVLMAAGSFVEGARNLGLVVFSGLYLASIALCALRLRAHLRATGSGVMASGADQAFLLFGVVGLMALLVFLDSFTAGGIGTPAPVVAVLNWVQLLYPSLLLLAARPFREPLRMPKAKLRLVLEERKAATAGPAE